MELLSKDNNIELRSEKVRNIVGQVPPRLTRFGITVILFIIIAFFLGMHFYEYEYVIDVKAIIYQSNNNLIINIKIPEMYIKKIKQGQKVLLNISNNSINSQIQTIPEILTISNTGNFYSTTIIDTSSTFNISIIDTIQTDAQVVTDKTNLLNRLFHLSE